MAKAPKEFNYRFSRHGDSLVTMRYFGHRRWEVHYRDQLVDSFKYKLSRIREFKKGRSYDLHDGAQLVLRYRKSGAFGFWEPYLNGTLAYETLKKQHNSIWIVWAAAAVVVPALVILRGGQDQAEGGLLAALAVGWLLVYGTLAILAKICWKPVAWIFATLWIAYLLLDWVLYIGNPVGFPPLIATFTTIVFRDVLVDARFIWNVLDKLSEYGG